jgi:DNA polymerase III alpha subunit
MAGAHQNLVPAGPQGIGALIDEQPVMVCGRVDSGQNFKIMAEEIYPLEETMERFTEHVGLHLPTVTLENGRLQEIESIVTRHKGDVPLKIWLIFPGGEKICVSADQNHYVSPSEAMIHEVQKVVGENSVKLTVKRDACLNKTAPRRKWKTKSAG